MTLPQPNLIAATAVVGSVWAQTEPQVQAMDHCRFSAPQLAPKLRESTKPVHKNSQEVWGQLQLPGAILNE